MRTAAAALAGLALAAASVDDDLPAVLWHAPFLAGGGFCSEAHDMAHALAAVGVSVGAVHHGDSYNGDFVAGWPPAQQRAYAAWDAAARGMRPGSVVAVCHSEPGAWSVPRPNYQTAPCPPRGAAYAVGRAMFETDRLPDGWAKRLNAMDEVWVPTEW